MFSRYIWMNFFWLNVTIGGNVVQSDGLNRERITQKFSMPWPLKDIGGIILLC
jgi:hypothetical protein